MVGLSNSGIYTIGNKNLIYINGKKLLLPPNYKSNNSNITVIGNRVFVNGYEYKNGKWKKTLRALWHYIF